MDIVFIIEHWMQVAASVFYCLSIQPYCVVVLLTGTSQVSLLLLSSAGVLP